MSITEPSTAPVTEVYAEAGLYEIRLKGQLEDRWADWFDGLTITREENGHTLLTGLVVDQAALHGLLRKVRDLGLPLLAVLHVEATESDGPANER